jgi:hypothetical protein
MAHVPYPCILIEKGIRIKENNFIETNFGVREVGSRTLPTFPNSKEFEKLL